MLKELVTFTESLDPFFKDIGLEPKEGLHIVLSLEEGADTHSRIAPNYEYRLYRKKKTEKDEVLDRSTAWARTGWMVDTNKCLDLPAKKIHSASPFCLAYKHGSPLSDTQLEVYFTKAGKLVADEAGSRYAQAFRLALNSLEKIQYYLRQIPEINPPEDADKDLKNRALKEGEYVIFYLDVSLDYYQQVSSKYLGDKLFNTGEYNATVGEDVFGTSAFFNGFPTKKPFLSHQTATFDIAGRISATEALRLFEFKDLIGRGIFPRPLPIFVYEDELLDSKLSGFDIKKQSLSLFKAEALKDPAQRKSHADIITELYEEANQNRQELGNYYLLYYHFGEIRDFDFVSRFEYRLKDEQGQPWQVDDWFEINYHPRLENVFQFQNVILPLILNNALVVRTKAKKDGESGGLLLKFFEEIDPQACRGADIYILILKYRQAFYDFIYKSKRQAVTQSMLEDILITGVLNDLRRDRYENRQHSEDRTIRQKLNVLFSLHHHFQPFNQSTLFMPNQLTALRPFMTQLAAGETSIESDEQFAFAAGQVIYYIQSKSKSEDRSYARLEPFLQQTDVKLFQQALLKLFDRYKHEPYSRRFQEPMANVIAYVPGKPMRSLMPLMLAGFFSKNVLFSDKTDENQIPEPTNEQ